MFLFLTLVAYDLSTFVSHEILYFFCKSDKEQEAICYVHQFKDEIKSVCCFECFQDFHPQHAGIWSQSEALQRLSEETGSHREPK